jgi:hypothetical protein
MAEQAGSYGGACSGPSGNIGKGGQSSPQVLIVAALSDGGLNTFCPYALAAIVGASPRRKCRVSQ